MTARTVFTDHTPGERFVRIDAYGVPETMGFNSSSTLISVTSVGGGAPVVASTTGSSVAFKTLIAGTNVTLVETPTDVTINSVAGGGGSGITSIVASGTGDETLIQSGAAPTAVLKMITAGAGITLASDGDQITVTNSAAGAVYTLSDDAAGTGVSLVNTPAPTAADFRLNTILGGAGIGVALVGSDVTITNTGVAQVYTLSDAAGGTGISIIAPATGGGNDFHNYQLKAGSGMSVALIGSDILLTATGGGGGAGSLTSAGGTTIIKDGAGPDFVIKGTILSGSMELITNTNTFGFDNRCIRIRDTAGNQPPTTDGSTASGTPSVAIGPTCTATVNNSVSVGLNNAVTQRAWAFGRNNTIAAVDSLALGVGNNILTTTPTRSIVVGIQSSVTSANSIVIGDSATCSGLRGTSIGNAANVSGSDAVGIGRLVIASAADAVAYGRSSTASNTGAVAYGAAAHATGTYAAAFGFNALATGNSSVCVGDGSNTSALRGIALGGNVKVTGTRAFATGSSDDSTVDLNPVADSFVMAKRATGTSTYYAVNSFALAYSRLPTWVSNFRQETLDVSLTAQDILWGTLLMDQSGSKNITFPTLASVLTLFTPWGISPVDAGGSFTIVNAKPANCTMIGGTGTLWVSAKGTTGPTFSKNLPAETAVVIKWFIPGGTTLAYAFESWNQEDAPPPPP